MKVPNCENALIPAGKLSNYLLNHDHTDGSSKARFFSQFGFDEDALSAMLHFHVNENDFAEKRQHLMESNTLFRVLQKAPLEFVSTSKASGLF